MQPISQVCTTWRQISYSIPQFSVTTLHLTVQPVEPEDTFNKRISELEGLLDASAGSDIDFRISNPSPVQTSVIDFKMSYNWVKSNFSKMLGRVRLISAPRSGWFPYSNECLFFLVDQVGLGVCPRLRFVTIGKIWVHDRHILTQDVNLSEFTTPRTAGCQFISLNGPCVPKESEGFPFSHLSSLNTCKLVRSAVWHLPEIRPCILPSAHTLTRVSVAYLSADDHDLTLFPTLFDLNNLKMHLPQLRFLDIKCHYFSPILYWLELIECPTEVFGYLLQC
jgi:hypothetical protein